MNHNEKLPVVKFVIRNESGAHGNTSSSQGAGKVSNSSHFSSYLPRFTGDNDYQQHQNLDVCAKKSSSRRNTQWESDRDWITTSPGEPCLKAHFRNHDVLCKPAKHAFRTSSPGEDEVIRREEVPERFQSANCSHTKEQPFNSPVVLSKHIGNPYSKLDWKLASSSRRREQDGIGAAANDSFYRDETKRHHLSRKDEFRKSKMHHTDRSCSRRPFKQVCVDLHDLEASHSTLDKFDRPRDPRQKSVCKRGEPNPFFKIIKCYDNGFRKNKSSRRDSKGHEDSCRHREGRKVSASFRSHGTRDCGNPYTRLMQENHHRASSSSNNLIASHTLNKTTSLVLSVTRPQNKDELLLLLQILVERAKEFFGSSRNKSSNLLIEIENFAVGNDSDTKLNPEMFPFLEEPMTDIIIRNLEVEGSNNHHPSIVSYMGSNAALEANEVYHPLTSQSDTSKIRVRLSQTKSNLTDSAHDSRTSRLSLNGLLKNVTASSSCPTVDSSKNTVELLNSQCSPFHEASFMCSSAQSRSDENINVFTSKALVPQSFSYQHTYHYSPSSEMGSRSLDGSSCSSIRSQSATEKSKLSSALLRETLPLPSFSCNQVKELAVSRSSFQSTALKSYQSCDCKGLNVNEKYNNSSVRCNNIAENTCLKASAEIQKEITPTTESFKPLKCSYKYLREQSDSADLPSSAVSNSTKPEEIGSSNSETLELTNPVIEKNAFMSSTTLMLSNVKNGSESTSAAPPQSVLHRENRTEKSKTRVSSVSFKDLGPTKISILSDRNSPKGLDVGSSSRCLASSKEPTQNDEEPGETHFFKDTTDGDGRKIDKSNSSSARVSHYNSHSATIVNNDKHSRIHHTEISSSRSLSESVCFDNSFIKTRSKSEKSQHHSSQPNREKPASSRSTSTFKRSRKDKKTEQKAKTPITSDKVDSPLTAQHAVASQTLQPTDQNQTLQSLEKDQSPFKEPNTFPTRSKRHVRGGEEVGHTLTILTNDFQEPVAKKQKIKSDKPLSNKSRSNSGVGKRKKCKNLICSKAMTKLDIKVKKQNLNSAKQSKGLNLHAKIESISDSVTPLTTVTKSAAPSHLTSRILEKSANAVTEKIQAMSETKVPCCQSTKHPFLTADGRKIQKKFLLRSRRTSLEVKKQSDHSKTVVKIKTVVKSDAENMSISKKDVLELVTENSSKLQPKVPSNVEKQQNSFEATVGAEISFLHPATRDSQKPLSAADNQNQSSNSAALVGLPECSMSTSGSSAQNTLVVDPSRQVFNQHRATLIKESLGSADLVALGCCPHIENARETFSPEDVKMKFMELLSLMSMEYNRMLVKASDLMDSKGALDVRTAISTGDKLVKKTSASTSLKANKPSRKSSRQVINNKSKNSRKRKKDDLNSLQRSLKEKYWKIWREWLMYDGSIVGPSRCTAAKKSNNSMTKTGTVKRKNARSANIHCECCRTRDQATEPEAMSKTALSERSSISAEDLPTNSYNFINVNGDGSEVIQVFNNSESAAMMSKVNQKEPQRKWLRSGKTKPKRNKKNNNCRPANRSKCNKRTNTRNSDAMLKLFSSLLNWTDAKKPNISLEDFDLALKRSKRFLPQNVPDNKFMEYFISNIGKPLTQVSASSNISKNISRKTTVRKRNCSKPAPQKRSSKKLTHEGKSLDSRKALGECVSDYRVLRSRTIALSPLVAGKKHQSKRFAKEKEITPKPSRGRIAVTPEHKVRERDLFERTQNHILGKVNEPGHHITLLSTTKQFEASCSSTSNNKDLSNCADWNADNDSSVIVSAASEETLEKADLYPHVVIERMQSAVSQEEHLPGDKLNARSDSFRNFGIGNNPEPNCYTDLVLVDENRSDLDGIPEIGSGSCKGELHTVVEKNTTNVQCLKCQISIGQENLLAANGDLAVEKPFAIGKVTESTLAKDGSSDVGKSGSSDVDTPVLERFDEELNRLTENKKFHTIVSVRAENSDERNESDKNDLGSCEIEENASVIDSNQEPYKERKEVAGYLRTEVSHDDRVNENLQESLQVVLSCDMLNNKISGKLERVETKAFEESCKSDYLFVEEYENTEGKSLDVSAGIMTFSEDKSSVVIKKKQNVLDCSKIVGSVSIGGNEILEDPALRVDGNVSPSASKANDLPVIVHNAHVDVKSIEKTVDECEELDGYLVTPSTVVGLESADLPATNFIKVMRNADAKTTSENIVVLIGPSSNGLEAEYHDFRTNGSEDYKIAQEAATFLKELGKTGSEENVPADSISVTVVCPDHGRGNAIIDVSESTGKYFGESSAENECNESRGSVGNEENSIGEDCSSVGEDKTLVKARPSGISLCSYAKRNDITDNHPGSNCLESVATDRAKNYALFICCESQSNERITAGSAEGLLEDLEIIENKKINCALEKLQTSVGKVDEKAIQDCPVMKCSWNGDNYIVASPIYSEYSVNNSIGRPGIQLDCDRSTDRETKTEVTRRNSVGTSTELMEKNTIINYVKRVLFGPNESDDSVRTDCVKNCSRDQVTQFPEININEKTGGVFKLMLEEELEPNSCICTEPIRITNDHTSDESAGRVGKDVSFGKTLENATIGDEEPHFNPSASKCLPEKDLPNSGKTVENNDSVNFKPRKQNDIICKECHGSDRSPTLENKYEEKSKEFIENTKSLEEILMVEGVEESVSTCKEAENDLPTNYHKTELSLNGREISHKPLQDDQVIEKSTSSGHKPTERTNSDSKFEESNSVHFVSYRVHKCGSSKRDEQSISGDNGDGSISDFKIDDVDCNPFEANVIKSGESCLDLGADVSPAENKEVTSCDENLETSSFGDKSTKSYFTGCRDKVFVEPQSCATVVEIDLSKNISKETCKKLGYFFDGVKTATTASADNREPVENRACDRNGWQFNEVLGITPLRREEQNVQGSKKASRISKMIIENILKKLVIRVVASSTALVEESSNKTQSLLAEGTHIESTVLSDNVMPEENGELSSLGRTVYQDCVAPSMSQPTTKIKGVQDNTSSINTSDKTPSKRKNFVRGILWVPRKVDNLQNLRQESSKSRKKARKSSTAFKNSKHQNFDRMNRINEICSKLLDFSSQRIGKVSVNKMNEFSIGFREIKSLQHPKVLVRSSTYLPKYWKAMQHTELANGEEQKANCSKQCPTKLPKTNLQSTRSPTDTPQFCSNPTNTVSFTERNHLAQTSIEGLTNGKPIYSLDSHSVPQSSEREDENSLPLFKYPTEATYRGLEQCRLGSSVDDPENLLRSYNNQEISHSNDSSGMSSNNSGRIVYQSATIDESMRNAQSSKKDTCRVNQNFTQNAPVACNRIALRKKHAPKSTSCGLLNGGIIANPNSSCPEEPSRKSTKKGRGNVTSVATVASSSNHNPNLSDYASSKNRTRNPRSLLNTSQGQASGEITVDIASNQCKLPAGDQVRHKTYSNKSTSDGPPSVDGVLDLSMHSRHVSRSPSDSNIFSQSAARRTNPRSNRNPAATLKCGPEKSFRNETAACACGACAGHGMFHGVNCSPVLPPCEYPTVVRAGCPGLNPVTETRLIHPGCYISGLDIPNSRRQGYFNMLHAMVDNDTSRNLSYNSSDRCIAYPGFIDRTNYDLYPYPFTNGAHSERIRSLGSMNCSQPESLVNGENIELNVQPPGGIYLKKAAKRKTSRKNFTVGTGRVLLEDASNRTSKAVRYHEGFNRMTTNKVKDLPNSTVIGSEVNSERKSSLAKSNTKRKSADETLFTTSRGSGGLTQSIGTPNCRRQVFICEPETSESGVPIVDLTCHSGLRGEHIATENSCPVIKYVGSVRKGSEENNVCIIADSTSMANRLDDFTQGSKDRGSIICGKETADIEEHPRLLSVKETEDVEPLVKPVGTPHHRLDRRILTLEKPTKVAIQKSRPTSRKICVDLNHHTVRSNSKKCYSVSSELTVGNETQLNGNNKKGLASNVKHRNSSIVPNNNALTGRFCVSSLSKDKLTYDRTVISSKCSPENGESSGKTFPSLSNCHKASGDKVCQEPDACILQTASVTVSEQIESSESVIVNISDASKKGDDKISSESVREMDKGCSDEEISIIPTSNVSSSIYANETVNSKSKESLTKAGDGQSHHVDCEVEKQQDEFLQTYGVLIDETDIKKFLFLKDNFELELNMPSDEKLAPKACDTNLRKPEETLKDGLQKGEDSCIPATRLKENFSAVEKADDDKPKATTINDMPKVTLEPTVESGLLKKVKKEPLLCGYDCDPGNLVPTFHVGQLMDVIKTEPKDVDECFVSPSVDSEVEIKSEIFYSGFSDEVPPEVTIDENQRIVINCRRIEDFEELSFNPPPGVNLRISYRFPGVTIPAIEQG